MRKLTYTEVSKLFREAGCELLSENYESVNNPIDYRCICGNTSKIKVSKFKLGQRCISCGKVKSASQRKFDPKWVREYFDKQSCKLMSEYCGIDGTLNYICSCGREAVTTFHNFKAGHRCQQCAIESRSGDKNTRWNPNREEIKLRDIMRKRCYRLVRYMSETIGFIKTDRTSRLLGYTSYELRKHLESNPNWSIVKNGEWHLDHIFPIKAFMDYGITDIKIINCLENLQPLAGTVNLQKHAIYSSIDFEAWLKSKGVYF
jgi:hypothetical protein